MAGTWLEDLLANLQAGAGPMAQPARSPFPDVPPPPPQGQALWDEIEKQQREENAVADRRNVAGMRRGPIVDPFGVPDMNSAGVQLGLEQGPAGTGVPGPLGRMPVGAPDGSPFGAPAPFSIAPPPSLAMAKSMSPPPAETVPPPIPPEAVPMPRPRPAEAPPGATDISAAQRAPVAPPVNIVPPAAAPAEPSFADRARGLAPALLAAGAALQGDNSVGAALMKRQEDQALAVQNASLTARALVSRGAPVEEVMAATRNPDLMKALVGKYFETKPAQVVNGRLVRERADGKVDTLADYSKDEERKPPSGFEKRPDGTLAYIKGGPADPKYLREKGEKNAAPSGYRWVDPEDPDKGLIAIPGGPGEKVDAEVAARLGLAKSFLAQLPDIRKRIVAGEVTGPIDALTAKIGIGGPGEIRRQVDSGAEALLRMLTGAGMNKDEAADYTRRYKVSPIDTVESLTSKMDQLERELNSVGETVGRGRGGWESVSKVLNGGKGYTKPSAGTVDIGGQKIQWSVN